MSIFHMGTGYRLPFGATVIHGVFGAYSGFGVGWRAAGWGGAISVFRDNFPSAGESFILLDGLGGRQ